MIRPLFRAALVCAAVAACFTPKTARADWGWPFPGDWLENFTKTLDTWRYGERYGFGGKRPSIAKFSPEDQKLLADLIREYATQNNGEAVTVHVNAPAPVHMRPYGQFFPWHQDYLAGLEKFLLDKGYSKFVPLPKYIPAEGNPIPRVFAEDKNGKLIVNNLNPANLDTWIAAGLQSKDLGKFVFDIRPQKDGKFDDTIPDSAVLSDTAVWPHNDTHNTIGGTMASFRSPDAPIFWLYHAFIDDIQYDWKQLKKSGRTRTEAELPNIKTARSFRAKVELVNGAVVLAGVDRDVKYLVTPDGTSFDALIPLLQGAEGKNVWVTGYFNDEDKTARIRWINVEKPMTGPGSSVEVFDKAGKKLGEFGAMSEVKVVGVSPDGKSLKVIWQRYVKGHGMVFGWVPKDQIKIGAEHVHGVDRHLGSDCKDCPECCGTAGGTKPSNTPGIMGSMPGHDHGAHDHGAHGHD